MLVGVESRPAPDGVPMLPRPGPNNIYKNNKQHFHLIWHIGCVNGNFNELLPTPHNQFVTLRESAVKDRKAEREKKTTNYQPANENRHGNELQSKCVVVNWMPTGRPTNGRATVYLATQRAIEMDSDTCRGHKKNRSTDFGPDERNRTSVRREGEGAWGVGHHHSISNPIKFAWIRDKAKIPRSKWKWDRTIMFRLIYSFFPFENSEM